MRFYISADGSDSAGDGSQEKPYKTVAAAVKAGTLVNTAGSTQIIPLTDITESGLTIIQSPKTVFNTTGSGHKIVFTSNVRLAYGSYELRNCEFQDGLDITENSYALLAGCTFNGRTGDDYCLRVRYGTTAAVEACTFDVTAGARQSGIAAYNMATVIMNAGLVFRGSFDSLFKSVAYGDFRLTGNTNTPDTAQAQGSRYQLGLHSTLSLSGRGEEVLGSALTAGTKDKSCSVY